MTKRQAEFKLEVVENFLSDGVVAAAMAGDLHFDVGREKTNISSLTIAPTGL